MTIYSLYVFDRHCACVYYHDWYRTKGPKSAGKGTILPAVSSTIMPQVPSADNPQGPASMFTSPRNTLMSTSGIVVAINEEPEMVKPLATAGVASQVQQQQQSQAGILPFDEEAKLVYGVMVSLRAMVKKLSKRDENFTAYRTSTYKLHLYDTPTLYKFILLTDPKADSSAARFALRQIYAGPFLDYVVRNPLVPMDSREQGIDNELFRLNVDRVIRGLQFFN